MANLVRSIFSKLLRPFRSQPPAPPVAVNVNEVFQRNSNRLFELSREYPSVINNGYRHIEVAIHLLQRFNLDKGYTIVDVGAASGIVSEKFALQFPENKVMSFEPIANSYQQLEAVALKCKNVKPFHAALGAEKKQITINISHRSTSSSLYEINEQISDSYFAENLKKEKSEQVEVYRMDEVIGSNEKIALIKLDVQGFELEVLKGAGKVLDQTALVLTEVMNHDFYVGAPGYFDIDNYLREAGFAILDIIPSIRRNEKLMEWDVIYYNKSIVRL